MPGNPRHAALAQVVENFAVAYDRVLEAHGLRLPKFLAYTVGMFLGLTDDEREACDWIFGRGPIGIAAWLADGRIDQPPPLARVDTRHCTRDRP